MIQWSKLPSGACVLFASAVLFACEPEKKSIATCGDARLDADLVLRLPDGSKRQLRGKLVPNRYPQAAFSGDCSSLAYVYDNEIGELKVGVYDIATDSTESFPVHCCPPNLFPFTFNGHLYVMFGSDYDVRILSVRRGVNAVSQPTWGFGSLLDDGSGFSYVVHLGRNSEYHVAKFDTLLAADWKWLEPSQAKAAINDRHAAVFGALVIRDFNTLAEFIHPSMGLRIGQDTYITQNDPVFFRSQVEHAMSDTATIVVGEQDGSGYAIYSSLKAEILALARSKYDEADNMSVNEQIGRGNCLNNLFDFYPGSIVVEYYWAGEGEQADFNWASTRFVYVDHEGVWYLTAVTHDHWCI